MLLSRLSRYTIYRDITSTPTKDYLPAHMNIAMALRIIVLEVAIAMIL